MGMDEARYFSSWIWSAVHFLTSSPKYQTAKEIAERLSLPVPVVTACLKQLSAWSFVRPVGARWEFSGGEYHIHKSSPYVSMHHQNWRARAVIDSQHMKSEGIHYTNIQTMSEEDFSILRELVLGFISDCDKLMSPSNPEEAVSLTFDLFKI